MKDIFFNQSKGADQLFVGADQGLVVSKDNQYENIITVQIDAKTDLFTEWILKRPTSVSVSKVFFNDLTI